MRKTLTAIALVASLWPLDAMAAHCRLGLLYRPSRGTCVTPRSFERDVGPSRRASRWERHRGRRFRMSARPSRRDRDAGPAAAPEVRAAAIPRPEAVPAPVVPAVAATAPAREEVRPVLPALPFVVNGNLSLNPMPRWGGDLGDMPRRAPAAR